jgi:predicted transcriptional regulator
MIEAIVGSTSAERALVFITAREQGYASEIARMFDTSVSQIQKQLDRMERDGLLINEKVGIARIYSFNPRYAFVPEVKALMEKALSMYPLPIQKALTMNRRRPRKKGKPL